MPVVDLVIPEVLAVKLGEAVPGIRSILGCSTVELVVSEEEAMSGFRYFVAG